MRRLLSRTLLAATLSALASAASAQTVVLVRHAEKVDASRDPVLSEAGTARARALAEDFGAEGPDLVLVSPRRRTSLTAQPTVEAFGAPVRVMPLDEGTQAHVAATLAEIAGLSPDDLVLIVGHSDTIPALVRALGAEAADMADCEYDRLTRVRLTAMRPVAQVTRCGAASTC